MDVYSVLRHTGYISNGEVVFRKNAEICNVTITKAGKYKCSRKATVYIWTVKCVYSFNAYVEAIIV